MDFSMFENIRVAPDVTKPVMRPPESGMNKKNRFPEHTPLAMAYVPFQQWEQPYSEEKAFERGTIFPELDLPFAPEEGCYEPEG
ncbi:spore coat associated protein CotJA [Porcipelethomonas sp.]|uniref:spore coat associated protein CotJA n=1 Tax=Porcipelethomonas sp. TaxID=2981675 RepID=UPI003EF805A2